MTRRSAPPDREAVPGAATNRATASPGAAWSYDGAGNLLANGAGGQHFYYDAENRQVAFCGLGTVGCSNSPNTGAELYGYDGEGRRVLVTDKLGQQTVYVYDAGGTLAAEYSAVAPTDTGLQYVTSDRLGSTRMLTNAAGTAVLERHDFLPYGTEVQTSEWRTGLLYGGSIASMKFTGKERDSETGLDYFGARYFSSAQGRFTSPDPLLNSGHPTDPQSWNRYAYTLNNPLKYADPDGLWQWAAGSCDDQCQANRKRFTADVEAARKAAAHYAAGSDERNRLERVLKAIGTENDKNGLKVAFGNLEGLVGAAYSPRTGTVTLDYGKSDARFDARPDLEASGFSREGEMVSDIIHEGTHRADNVAGYDFGIQVGGPNQGRDLRRLFNAESTAYGNQILFHRATDTRPLTFREFWNSSWSTVDQHTIDSAVGRKAQQSVDYVKKDLGIK